MTISTLTDATLQRRTSDVVATWTVAGDLPLDTWTLSTTLVGGANGPIHQFGVKFDGDRVVTIFVFDHGTATHMNLSVDPRRLADTFTAVFPLGDLAVAERGRWTATLTVGHKNLDTIMGDL